jgi:hypothetical protein
MFLSCGSAKIGSALSMVEKWGALDFNGALFSMEEKWGVLDFSCPSSSWMVQKWGAQDLAGLIFSPHALNFVLSCFECTFAARYGFDGE